MPWESFKLHSALISNGGHRLEPMAPYWLFRFVVQPLRLQPILKGLSGDADHVADADRLEQSGVGEFIGRSAADTKNGCDVIHGVCSALGRPFFVGAHKIISLANSILKWPLEALRHKGFLLIPC